MKSLEYLNQTPPALRTNFNRDSSAVKSRGGYVIHSGIHRSTAFVSDAEAIQSLEFWRDAGALNGWVEATIDGAELADCELNALTRIFPDWTFQKINSCGNPIYTASQKSGGFETRVSDISWQTLNGKLT